MTALGKQSVLLLKINRGQTLYTALYKKNMQKLKYYYQF